MKTNLILIIFFLALHFSLAAQPANRVFVQFATDKWDLTNQTKARLDSLTDSLDLSDKIELHGYCDARGSLAYNDQLSVRRVNAVRTYLLNNGWTDKDIIVAKGHGESDPLAENNSEKNMQLNRRVELRILRGAVQKEPPAPQQVKITTTLTKQLTDTVAKAGDVITLKNMQFEGGRHYLLPESMPVLEELLQVMKDHPSLVIKIVGHICCENGPGDGFDIDLSTTNLSETRARAVRDYLVQHGIAGNRVSYEGKAHTAPVFPFPEKTEEERTVNRRVEIIIVKR